MAMMKRISAESLRDDIVKAQGASADQPGQDMRFYLKPVGFLEGVLAQQAIDAGFALPFQGDHFGVTAFDVMVKCRSEKEDGFLFYQSYMPQPQFEAWRLSLPEALAEALEQQRHKLTRPRSSFAGLALDKPLLMGIVNVTPDSFSDGGRYYETAQAVSHGLALWQAGAKILDIGGESTRPGSQTVSPEEEINRVVPVIRGLRSALQGHDVKLSIDSRNSATMAAAVAAGADIVNDVTALSGDSESVSFVKGHKIPTILMHMQGQPQTMQEEPFYEQVSLDIYDYLSERASHIMDVCDVALDPGIGFGKTVAHNCALLHDLALFQGLDCPVLLGVSRKSFIAKLDPAAPAADQRLAGSLASGLYGVSQAAQILRVHDVAETQQALKVWQALS